MKKELKTDGPKFAQLTSTENLLVFKFTDDPERLVSCGLTGREKYAQLFRIPGGLSLDVLSDGGDNILSFTCGASEMDCIGRISKARVHIILRSLLAGYGNDLAGWGADRSPWCAPDAAMK